MRARHGGAQAEQRRIAGSPARNDPGMMIWIGSIWVPRNSVPPPGNSVSVIALTVIAPGGSPAARSHPACSHPGAAELSAPK